MLIYCGKCLDGEVLRKIQCQRVSGWCKDILLCVNGRPGADFLKKVGREVRVSPLQRLSAHTMGIQVVPRKCFRPEKDLRAFFMFRPEEKTQTK